MADQEADAGCRAWPAVGPVGLRQTFVVFDLAAALGTGQPFLGHAVKRQCGVLLIAAEGASEVRLRLDAVVRNKCGNMERAPFRWYETTPLLLQKGAVETLIAMARQADDSLQQEFGLPLGLVVIDTIAACAGYPRAGDENDSAAAQTVMNVLKAIAETLGCFVLGVDHFGKNVEAGTRGASSKEGAADVVLACLGDKELNGSVTNTRLAVRKNRGGQQGQPHTQPVRPRSMMSAMSSASVTQFVVMKGRVRSRAFTAEIGELDLDGSRREHFRLECFDLTPDEFIVGFGGQRQDHARVLMVIIHMSCSFWSAMVTGQSVTFCIGIGSR